ncbi:unannotated protein [freshwater metagenome]|uniref:Unannotated protein n=1 Tax=freshwater metagenome TaxID=449393 RepID=A0A6J7EJY5_9ZZZZ
MRPIGHDDRISIFDHLDELRSRLIWCVVAFVIAFGFTYWQNSAILDIVNRPLERAQQPGKGNDPLEQAARYDRAVGLALGSIAPALRETSSALDRLASEPGVSPETRASALQAQQGLDRAARRAGAATALVPTSSGRRPVTLGVAEPFTATFTVAAYAALILILPFLLWQAYAFVLPAFDRRERRTVIPLMALAPLLFAGGVLFGYFVALPRAVDFLQNFNDDSFDILVQARDYYRFVIFFVGLMGIVFQVPIGVLILTRTGLVTVRTLWRHQGYVILGIAVVAAVITPTPDPFTMLLTMAPLVLLYELSIGLAWLLRPRDGGIRGRWEGGWNDEEDGPTDETPDPGAGTPPARVS